MPFGGVGKLLDEIVLSQTVYAAIAKQVPEARPATLESKGKAEALKAYVIPAAAQPNVC